MDEFWEKAFKYYLWVKVILSNFSSIIFKYTEARDKEAKPSSIWCIYIHVINNKFERSTSCLTTWRRVWETGSCIYNHIWYKRCVAWIRGEWIFIHNQDSIIYKKDLGRP
jgi:hypothetical protein